MWFLTLLILALAAFFIVKAVKSQAQRKLAEQDRLSEGSGLAGTLPHESQAQTSTTDPSETSVEPGNEATGSATASGGMATATAAMATAAASASLHAATQGLSTDDLALDVQEMIKILNLAEPDAGRLAISREEFSAIRHGDEAAMPSPETLAQVADRLRQMLA